MNSNKINKVKLLQFYKMIKCNARGCLNLLPLKTFTGVLSAGNAIHKLPEYLAKIICPSNITSEVK